MTTTKFQKLVFLIQTKARMTPSPYKFLKHQYGAYSEDLRTDLHALSDWSAIETSQDWSSHHGSFYKYQLTSKGQKFLEQLLGSKKLNPSKLLQLRKLIEEYGRHHYEYLVRISYEIVPDQSSFKTRKHRAEDNLLTADALWEKRYAPDDYASTLCLATIDYCRYVLKQLSEETDQVHRGVILSCIEDLLRAIQTADLTAPQEGCTQPADTWSEIPELLDFLSHYCQETSVCHPIDNLDASDFMDEEGFKRLRKAFETNDQSYF